MTEDQKHQAHGMTVGQMKDLHYKQIHDPGSIKMIPANNGGDKITDPYFEKDYGKYMLPEHEAHLYHVAAEARTFASGGATPTRTSIPAIHKLTKEAYEFQKKNKAFEGQIVHILHNPELPPVKAGKKVDDGDDSEDLNLLTVPELKDKLATLTGEPVKITKKADLIAAIESLQE